MFVDAMTNIALPVYRTPRSTNELFNVFSSERILPVAILVMRKSYYTLYRVALGDVLETLGQCLFLSAPLLCQAGGIRFN